MLDLAAKVNANEPGCHLYKLCKDANGGYTVMELYEDADAMAAHGASEHFKASGAGFKGLMGGAPEIIRMDVVGYPNKQAAPAIAPGPFLQGLISNSSAS